MSNTGWSDDRLMEAYDAIAAVRADYATPEYNLPELRKLLAAIEDVDAEIAILIAERDEAEAANGQFGVGA